jgi:hypothetical protein
MSESDQRQGRRAECQQELHYTAFDRRMAILGCQNEVLL